MSSCFYPWMGRYANINHFPNPENTFERQCQHIKAVMPQPIFLPAVIDVRKDNKRAKLHRYRRCPPKFVGYGHVVAINSDFSVTFTLRPDATNLSPIRLGSCAGVHMDEVPAEVWEFGNGGHNHFGVRVDAVPDFLPLASVDVTPDNAAHRFDLCARIALVILSHAKAFALRMTVRKLSSICPIKQGDDGNALFDGFA